MGQIKISKIELEVGENKFKLSLAEARELKKILDDTFPNKEVVYIPSTPIYIDRYPQYRWPYGTWHTYYADNETLYLSNKTTQDK